jgi:hypothetical protein
MNSQVLPTITLNVRELGKGQKVFKQKYQSSDSNFGIITRMHDFS